jgi:hypothetical protein
MLANGMLAKGMLNVWQCLKIGRWSAIMSAVSSAGPGPPERWATNRFAL